MLNKSFLLLIACMLVFTVACGQDDTTGGSAGGPIIAPTNAATALPGGHPAVGGGDATSKPTDHGSVAGGKEVRISDEVKAKWKVAEIELTDTSSATKKVLKLDVGKKVAVKGTNFKILAVVLVPHYVIYEDHIGSKSNEPNNPAVLMELYDGDNVVARGWIFKTFTTFNSFVHEKYAVALLM